MNRNISIYMLALVVSTIIAHTPSRAEQISISPYWGNSYTIPPERTTNSIRFDLTMTDLQNPPNNHYYGYGYRVDGGSWSTVTNVGFAHNPYSTYFNVDLGAGSHTVEVRLLEYIYPPGVWQIKASASTNVSLTQQYRITVENSFGGGNVLVDGGTYASGTSFTWNAGTNHTLQAIDGQFDGTYVQRFDNWSTGATSLSIGISVNANATYRVNFKKEFNIVFQNNYPGYGNGGVISVNGTQYSSPTSSFAVRQDNTITGGVVNTYEVINGIEYTFGSWSPGGSTSASTQFTPGDHTTYTANFNAKPLPPPNVSAGGTVGDYVRVTWTEHPSQYVSQYQIWRKVKPPGQQEGAPQLLTTVSRGTTSFTDYEYIVTDGYTHALLWYDVRAYFSVNGTYSDPNWVSAFGRQDLNPKFTDGQSKAVARQSLPTEYAISYYPNPFNPSTTFRYQLVEDAHVSLTVYDIMGREIATLVQAQQSAGYHSAQWDGKDSDGKQLSSGIYLYRFLAVPISGKEPYRSSGKLVITK
jgi:hypothetical protein